MFGLCVVLLLWQEAGPIMGRFSHKLQLTPGNYIFNYGLAISRDGAHMAITSSLHCVTLYSLPSGDVIRKIGGLADPTSMIRLQSPGKMCFTATGTLLVAGGDYFEVVEVTLEGARVRTFGYGVLDGIAWGLATNDEVIAVGSYRRRRDRGITLFDVGSGDCFCRFGSWGPECHQLFENCNAIRFHPNGEHLLVANGDGNRSYKVSTFTLTGEYVSCFGEGQLLGAGCVEFADNSDIIVCDWDTMHRVCVFTPDGSTLLREWGDVACATVDGMFNKPTDTAMCDGKLYVLDYGSPRVQVFV